nr:ribonuclease H-like domain-containing protein [Tanacetum cinerariifolium]
MYSFDMKNIVLKEILTCLVAKATLDESLLWHRRLDHINFKNINKLVKDNLVRGLPLKRFENNQTCVACLKGKQHKASSTKDETSEIFKNFIKEIENLVDKKVKIIRCDNGTEFKNKVMDDFCREKGKFDGKSDEGFFVGYSLSSKAFRVYNTRTKKVEENFHIRILDNKPMIEGNGPKWLFDIDSLTQSMNYVPITVGTISDESASTQGDLNTVTSLKKEAISQVNFVMPISKDASYFDSLSNDVEDGPHSEDDDKDKSEDDSSPKEVNTIRQHVNTASIEVNTGHFDLNTVDPSFSIIVMHKKLI